MSLETLPSATLAGPGLPGVAGLSIFTEKFIALTFLGEAGKSWAAHNCS